VKKKILVRDARENRWHLYW